MIDEHKTYFPKKAFEEIDEFSKQWSEHLWRIQEVAKTVGQIDENNFRRMEMRRCILMATAAAFLNGVFDTAGKPTCPIRCVSFVKQKRRVSVRDKRRRR